MKATSHQTSIWYFNEYGEFIIKFTLKRTNMFWVTEQRQRGNQWGKVWLNHCQVAYDWNFNFCKPKMSLWFYCQKCVVEKINWCEKNDAFRPYDKLIIFEGAKAVQNDWMILPFNKAWFTVVGSVVQRYNISCIWSQAFLL